MATNPSTQSNRDAATMSGYRTAGPNGTKPGDDYVANPSGDDGDTGSDQSASGKDSSNGGSSGNPSSGSGTTRAGDGGTADQGGGTLSGIGDITDFNGNGSGLELAGAGAPLQPVFDTVNGVVDDVTGPSGLVQGIVDVANTAGVGTIGAAPASDGHSNLITDVLNMPGGILGGDLNGSLSHITTDLSDTLGATTGLAGDVLGGTGLPTDQLLGGSSGKLVNDLVKLPGNALDGGIPHTLGDLTDTASGTAGDADGAGGTGLLQPVTNLVDSTGDDLQGNSAVGVDNGGTLGGSAGNFGGSSSGDAAHAEIGPQSDDGQGVGILSSSDTGHTADVSALDVGSDGPEIVNVSALSDADGVNALPDAIGSGSGSLLTVNGGNNADNGGVAGGSIGDTNGSSSGHLVDADAGPQDNGLGVGVLSEQPDGDHTATASVVDVGQDGPQLADVGVLAGDMIDVPSLNGAGVDSLTGSLPGIVSGAPEAVTPTPVVADLTDATDLLPGSVGGDHGIVDVSGHHII
jgi:hypothetical protein